MRDYLLFLLGVGSTVVGFMLSEFWTQPILQYRELKRQVIEDLVFYANAGTLFDKEQYSGSRVQERTTRNRRLAAQFKSHYSLMPAGYRWWLGRRSEDPLTGARELVGLSNTVEDPQEVARRREAIIQAFKLPPEPLR